MGVAFFGPIFGIAYIIYYKNPFMKDIDLHVNCLIARFHFTNWWTQFVLLNLCIQCLTEFQC